MNKKTAFGTVIIWKFQNDAGKEGYKPGIIIGHDKTDIIVCPFAFVPLPQTVKTQFGYVRASKVQTINSDDIVKKLGYVSGSELRTLRNKLHSIFSDMIYGKHANETLNRVYTQRTKPKNGLEKLAHKVLSRPDNDDFLQMVVDSLSEEI